VKSDDFVHLHLHSHASAFDGFGKEERFAARAAELGQAAISFSEHGTLRGIPAAQKACDEHGVKFIPGIEAYLCDDASQRGLTKEERRAIQSGFTDKELAKAAVKKAGAERKERDHITMWAMSEVGLKNLYKMSSFSWNEGFYSKPRIDLKTIAAHREGVIVSTGCPGGVIPKTLREGKYGATIARMDYLAEAFGDRFYVEVMPHLMDDLPELQVQLIRLSEEYGITAIATQDAHYPCRSDALAQEVLLCVQTGESLDDPERFAQRAFGHHDFFVRSRSEMMEAFAKNLPELPSGFVRKMCDATVEFADRCDASFAEMPPGTYLAAPALPAAVGDYDEWLLDLCMAGFHARFGHELEDAPPDYFRRLEYEFGVLTRNKFSAYIIMVWDVVRFCGESRIRVGPGRGSAAGSLICYLLGITNLDPVKHGLYFERFIAPGRSDLPDIDVDIQHDRRPEILAYLREKYGDDHVAQISTNITLKGKGALRDVGKAHGVPVMEIERVSAVIADGMTEETSSDDDSIAVAIRESEVGRKFAEKYPDVASAAMALEGNLRSVGMHPAGIVVSSVPLRDIVPLESRAPVGASERFPVIAFDMEAVEKAGLVKADFLGLKQMTVQARAALDAGVAVEDSTYEDPEVLQAFTDGRFGGVFQYDSAAARSLCRGFTFERFADIAVMTAINRPGPKQTGLSQAYIDRSKDPSLVPEIHPVYDRLTAETYGVLVYQEQIIELAKSLAGYLPEEADAFRRKVAKKKGLAGDQEKFVSGAVESGMDPEAAQKLFQSIVGFGAYAFGKSHAYVYAAVAYQDMWFKVRHPGPFFAATLTVRDAAEIQLRVASEARREGISVLPPDVNHSRIGFACVDEGGELAIVGSIADIKGVGVGTAQKIVDGKPYTTLKDFYDRTRGAGGGRVTRATFRFLAQSTAFRSICANTRILAENADEIWRALEKGYEIELDPEGVPDYDRDDLIRKASERYPIFVDAGGRGEFDAVYDGLGGAITRAVFTPDEAPTEGPDSVFLLAQLNRSKIFSDGGGTKSAKVSLLSPSGMEIAARADQDVLDSCGVVLSTQGTLILAMIHVRPARGGGVSYGLEGAWPAAEAHEPEPSALFQAVARPTKTRPRDPMAGFARTPIGGTFKVEGLILRVRKHKDKRGETMLTVGLLGERGYLKFFVFSSRYRGGADARRLKPGMRVGLRLKKLSEDAAFLSDASVEVM